MSCSRFLLLIKKMKKKYSTPKIYSVSVYLEEGIAAGSASVRPQNGSNQVMEQWYQEDTQTKEFDWNEL